MKEIKIIKTRIVETPVRAHEDDAGMDFFIPNNFEEYKLLPLKNIKIPLGIIMIIPEGWMGLFLNRSSIASRDELLVGAQVIDSSYRGEVHADLHNVGSNPILLNAKQKVTQLVLLPIGLPKIILTTLEDEQFKIKTLRNNKGFGSTDKESLIL